MDEHEETHEESHPAGSPSLLRGVLELFRMVAIAGAMVLVGVGLVLAYQLFFFFKGIVAEPEGVVQSWQSVVVPAPERIAEADPPAIQREERSVGTPAPPPADVVPPQTDGNPSAGTADSAAPSPVAGADRPDSPPIVPEPAVTTETPADPRRPSHDGAVGADDRWFELAERLLSLTETGRLGWFAGMCFLAVFCWLLGKIPTALLTTGTRFLVDLFKVGRDA